MYKTKDTRNLNTDHNPTNLERVILITSFTLYHSRGVLEDSLALLLLFSFWFLEVDFLCIIVAVFFIRVEILATYFAKEVVCGLGENLVGNEHTNLDI
jgi:hypothetical protein